MRAFALGLIALVGLAATPALAIDPGVATGGYVHEGQKLAFTHAVALSQDNVEGVLDHKTVMRVLLTDEELPPAVLEGLIFTPVWAMGRQGRVRGVLLEFDPADKTSLQAVVLAKPGQPGQSLTNISRSNTEGLWKRLDVSPTRISGEYGTDDADDMAFTFSAPVFTNAVQQDLKGPDAQKSEQVRVLIARMEAVARGDLPAALALSTPDSDLRNLPPEAVKQFKAQVADSLKQLKAAKRVVVRRDTAAVLTPDGSWYSLTLVDGAWKSAD